MGIHEDLNVPKGKFKSSFHKAALNIMFTGHWLTAGINSTLRSSGISEPQFNVLTLVYAAKGKPVSAGHIKSGMIQRESNITRIVDKLVNRGWITRETCPENRRKVDIGITEEGSMAFKEASAAVMSFHADLKGRLTGDELESLSSLLDKLRDNLQTSYSESEYSEKEKGRIK